MGANKKRFLCVCTWGHSRSVGMVRYVNKHGHFGVACGVQGGGIHALRQLSEWADVILLAETRMVHAISQEFVDKVVDLNIGPDKWVNPYSKDLERTIHERMQELKVLD